MRFRRSEPHKGFVLNSVESRTALRLKRWCNASLLENAVVLGLGLIDADECVLDQSQWTQRWLSH